MTKKISADAAVQAEDGTGVVAKKETPKQSWHERNPEKSKAYQKAWRDKNKQKMADYQKAWRDKNKQKLADKQKAWRAAMKEADPEAFAIWKANSEMVYKYGRSIEDYERKLAEQGGKCAICPRTPEEQGRRLSWDHDHACCPGYRTCGKCVRALLCSRCNIKISWLENGDYAPHEQYLRRWKAIT